jgi:hypothetical protein
MGYLSDPDLEFRDLDTDELRAMVSGSGESVLRGGRAMMELGRLTDPGFLAEAGWDRGTRVLSLPSAHPLLACPSPGCGNALYGRGSECGRRASSRAIGEHGAGRAWATVVQHAQRPKEQRSCAARRPDQVPSLAARADHSGGSGGTARAGMPWILVSRSSARAAASRSSLPGGNGLIAGLPLAS